MAAMSSTFNNIICALNYTLMYKKIFLVLKSITKVMTKKRFLHFTLCTPHVDPNR